MHTPKTAAKGVCWVGNMLAFNNCIDLPNFNPDIHGQIVDPTLDFQVTIGVHLADDLFYRATHLVLGAFNVVFRVCPHLLSHLLEYCSRQCPYLKRLQRIFAQTDTETLSNSDRFDFHLTEDKGHGRNEVRAHFTTSASGLPMVSRWKGLQTVGIVISEREEKGKKSTECRYYISSLKNDATLFAKAVRSHWGIENSLHYVLDVAFREDECRIRKEDGPENFAVLRHIARNLLQQETTKMSIKQKQFRSACDDTFLTKVLFG
jgi:predicted transposase YbfD/YdcC